MLVSYNYTLSGGGNVCGFGFGIVFDQINTCLHNVIWLTKLPTGDYTLQYNNINIYIIITPLKFVR